MALRQALDDSDVIAYEKWADQWMVSTLFMSGIKAFWLTFDGN